MDDISNIHLLDDEIEYKPFRRFQKVGEPPYLGVELEIVFETNEDRLKCKNILDVIKHIQIVKETSIENGFEIVTDPMNIKHQIILWKILTKILTKYKARCDKTCGLHIHIDKTNNALKSIPLIFYNKNKNKLELIAKRSENKFCMYPNCKQDICVYKGKNSAVNIRFNSIELRIFRCSVIFKNIIKFLKFANDVMVLETDDILTKYGFETD
jgi:hypothetical protein